MYRVVIAGAVVASLVLASHFALPGHNQAAGATGSVGARQALAQPTGVLFLPLLQRGLDAPPGASLTPEASPSVEPTAVPTAVPSVAPGTMFSHLGANQAWRMTLDEENDELWVATGTWGGGAVRWDLYTGTYTKYLVEWHDDSELWFPNQLPDNRVYDVATADDGSTWFATHYGASRLAPDGSWQWHGRRAKRKVELRWADQTRECEAFESLDGTWLGEVGTLSGRLAWFGSGCDADAPHPELDDRIALVERGGCAYREKVLNAQSRGATAVVVVNSDSEPMDWMLTAEDGDRVDIPAVMIPHAPGSDLPDLLRQGSAVSVTLHAGLAGQVVKGVEIDRRGDVWFGTEEGVCRLREEGDVESWQCYTTRNSPLVHSNVTIVVYDPNRDDVWLGTGEAGSWSTSPGAGINVLSADGSWRSYTEDDGMPTNRTYDIALELLPSGETVAWTANGQSGACRLSRTEGVLWLGPHNSPLGSEGVSGNVNEVGVSHGGDKWFGLLTTTWVLPVGADPLDSTVWRNEAYGYTESFAFGTDGTVYINPPGRVVVLEPDGASRELRTADVLPTGGFRAVDFDDAGNRWLAVFMGCLWRQRSDNGDWDMFGSGGWGTQCKVMHLALDHGETSNVDDDVLWFVEWADGEGPIVCRQRLDPLLQIDDGEGLWCWSKPDTPELPSYVVARIAIDHDGSKWIAGFNGGGVCRMETIEPAEDSVADLECFTKESTNGGLVGDAVWRFDIDKDGNKWFGSRGWGVSKLLADNTTWITYTHASTSGKLPHNWVGDVKHDPATGQTLFGTANGVGIINEDGTWEDPITVDDGLWSCPATIDPPVECGSLIYAVDVDPDGYRWFGSSTHSVSRLSPNGEWTYWTPPDGIPAFGQILDFAFDPDDFVWIAAPEGLNQLFPGEPGPESDDAMPFPAGTTLHQSLSSADDVDVYAVDVITDYTRIEVVVSDPDDSLVVGLARQEDSLSMDRGRGGVALPPELGRPVGLATLDAGEKRLVWDVTTAKGEYLIYVASRDGREPIRFPHRYTLRLGLTEPGNAVRTLILTHLDRLLVPDGGDAQRFVNAVSAFAAHDTVGGLVYWDFEEVGDDVWQAYQDWKASSTDPADFGRYAQAFNDALQKWIWKMRAEHLPRLQYVVLLGDDMVIPYRRVRIEPAFVPGVGEDSGGWKRESEYMPFVDPPIKRDSTIGKALLDDGALTDDVYASRSAVPWGHEGFRLDLPEISVGRLVESVDDMSGILEAYVTSDGLLDIDAATVIGHSFMGDSTQRGARYLENAGIGDVEEQSGDWGRNRLLRVLLGDKAKLVFFATHATHWQYETAIQRESVLATDIAEADVNLSGQLVYGLGCHAGLNVPGTGHEYDLDFPEAWQGKGVTYIAPTGYAYGYPGELQYQEDLMAEFTRLLVSGEGMAVGDALVQAKRDYFWDTTTLNHFHAKTLAGTVLYGLPMYRVRVPGGSGRPVVAPEEPEVKLGAIARPVPEMMATQRLTATIASDTLELVIKREGSFYTFRGLRPRSEGGEPVQPRFRYQLTEVRDRQQPSQALEAFAPRGAIWLGGAYWSQPGFDPLVRRAGSLCATPHGVHQDAPTFDGEGPYPAKPVVLRTIPVSAGSGTVLVGARDGMLLFTAGQYYATRKSEWLFERMVVELTYAKRGDKKAEGDTTAPTISEVTVTQQAGSQRLSVPATDVSGVWRVLATYTDGLSEWRSVELVATGSGDMWVGDIPARTIALVQAVDVYGNVAAVDNQGAFYGQ